VRIDSPPDSTDRPGITPSVVVYAWQGDRPEGTRPPAWTLSLALAALAAGLTLAGVSGAWFAQWILQDSTDSELRSSESVFAPPLEPLECAALDQEITNWYQGSGDFEAGQLTVLVFFETWCPHCQRQAPEIQSWHKELSGQGLNVIGLTHQIRSTDAQIKRFIQQHRWTFPVGRDAGGVADAYGVSSVPSVVVLQQGEILWIGHPAQLDAAGLSQRLKP